MKTEEPRYRACHSLFGWPLEYLGLEGDGPGFWICNLSFSKCGGRAVALQWEDSSCFYAHILREQPARVFAGNGRGGAGSLNTMWSWLCSKPSIARPVCTVWPPLAPGGVDCGPHPLLEWMHAFTYGFCPLKLSKLLEWYVGPVWEN